MKYSLLLFLAPLGVWSRACTCGQANQNGAYSRNENVIPRAENADEMLDRRDVHDGLAEKRDDLYARLINGKPTGLHEYPFIAAVVYNSGAKRISCPGAIIDKKHILITAHCVNGIRANNIGVYAGSNKFDVPSAKLRTVAAIHPHPKWDSERRFYDVALLQLQDPLSFDRNTNIVCVPSQPRDFNNQTATALAWGSPSSGEGQLVQTKFETHNLDSCSVRGTGGPQFCTYAPGEGVCDNASDGPLLLWQEPTSRRYFAVGLSSWGQSCKKFPEVATDLTQLKPWIQEVVGAGGGTLCP
ncbi:tripsin [Pochonia chlamydosporia 170]|uniref:Tripsin n=1 Tax=Pochonia chlamydosporia 170 TaxID=1380566 RepID=A0A179F9T9_METCM|nr:tripsin [Pochonia chlamydosporia 170]OAQ62051.1 tripsin [Pochonia chlamydosporia 170]